MQILRMWNARTGAMPEEGPTGRHHSVLFRLILIFLLVLTPIVGIGVAITQGGMQMLDDQITYSLTSQVEFKVRELENQMTSVKNQISQLIGERGMLRFSGMSDMLTPYEQLSQLNNFQERLNTIQTANSFVEQIELYLPRLERKVVAVGSLETPTIEDLDAQELSVLLDISRTYINRIVYAGGELLYTEQAPISIAIGNERVPRLVFKVTFNIETINRFFSEILSDNASKHVLLFGNGERLPPMQDGVVDWVLSGSEDAQQAQTVWADGSAYYVIQRYSKALDATCLIYAERDQAFTALYTFQRFFILLIAFVAGAVVIYSIYAYVSVYTPLQLLAGAFNKLASGEMDFQIQYRKRDEFHFLTTRFNLMLNRLKTTVNQLYEQRILMQQAQLKQLQAQINPHFLYNSFFILDNMIAMEDIENASQFSRKLGRYFQYVTRDSRDMVPLWEEIEHARSYVDIQRIRFGQRVEIDFPKAPDWAKSIQMPRLTLQPIIENAFVHSLEKCASGGVLRVQFSHDEDAVGIQVENNGVSDAQNGAVRLTASMMDTDASREVTGLLNVHRRLLLTHGAGLTCHSRPPDWLVIHMRLRMPIEKIGREEDAVSHTDRG